MIFKSIVTNILVPYFLGAATLSGLLFFFGKKIFLHFLSKDIEKYKSQLSEKAEVLKTHLAMYTYEQNVTFSRIDKQRANAISEVFLAMRRWTKPTTQIIASFPIVNASSVEYLNYYTERGEDAHKLSKEMAEILGDNSIYFDEDLYRDLVKLTNDCLNMSASFLQPIRRGIGEEHSFEEMQENIENERNSLNQSFLLKHSPLAQKITTNFRLLLGSIKIK